MQLQRILCLSSLHLFGTIAVLLPLPPGPFNVTLLTEELIDYGRTDPFAPQPEPRALMVSVFEPAKCTQTVSAPYMPPFTASYYAQNLSTFDLPKDVLEKIQIPVCASGAPGSDAAVSCEVVKSPVVLFSPGLSAPRLIYNQFAAAVASHGFTVISIDHPYDGTIVEYPDGHAVFDIIDANNTQLLTKDVGVRAQDASFVIDQLANSTVAARLTTRPEGTFDTDKVAMFGHSLGGATTAAATANDSRIVGGVNLDGAFFGDVINTGLSKPFLLFTHENITNPTWDEIWPRLQGFKLQLELANSTHNTFTDAAADIQALGLTDLGNKLIPALGSLQGDRAVDIVSAYVSAFAKFVLEGDEDDILRGPSGAYPEVSFTRQG